MIAPDGISPLTRYAALVADVPVIRLAEPDAKDLGLREGQIVQGSVQARGDRTLFELNGRFFDLPPVLQRVAPGDLRWFRVARQADGLVLKMLPGAPGLASAPQESDDSRPLIDPRSSLSQRADMAQPAVSVRHLALLNSAGSASSLASALVPGQLESKLIDLGAMDLARALALSRLRTEGLSATAIEQAVARAGLWGEAALAAGKGLQTLDLKILLRQIGRLLAARSAGDGEIDEAVDEIERKQLDAVQSATEGRQAFSVTLPFADSPAVSLRFERQAAEEGSGGRASYSIDIHVAPPQTGDIWLKTTVSGNSVDVNVWTYRPEVARLAQAEQPGLFASLQEAGLALRAFRVLEGSPPGLPSSSPPPRVSTLGLDLQA